MSDLYPYCSKCDNELNPEESELNEKYKNLFYPICNECLKKHVKKIVEIVNSEENEIKK